MKLQSTFCGAVITSVLYGIGAVGLASLLIQTVISALDDLSSSGDGGWPKFFVDETFRSHAVDTLVGTEPWSSPCSPASGLPWPSHCGPSRSSACERTQAPARWFWHCGVRRRCGYPSSWPPRVPSRRRSSLSRFIWRSSARRQRHTLKRTWKRWKVRPGKTVPIGSSQDQLSQGRPLTPAAASRLPTRPRGARRGCGRSTFPSSPFPEAGAAPPRGRAGPCG